MEFSIVLVQIEEGNPYNIIHPCRLYDTSILHYFPNINFPYYESCIPNLVLTLVGVVACVLALQYVYLSNYYR